MTNETDLLARRFEEVRPRLRAAAWRMLGSAAEADDAVQEAWLRLSRAGADGVENLGGWLTTVVARVCLDMLRSRRSRREDPLEPAEGDPAPVHRAAGDAEEEAMLADSVGMALLVVLDRLSPAERVAFVLHDLFDLPFEQIAPIVGRNAAAARQLASRARRRVRGSAAVPDRTRQRELVDAFLAASRAGDFQALLSVLDPEVVFRVDAAAARMGSVSETRGAHAVAELFNGRAQAARPARVDGAPAIAVVLGGQLRIVLLLAIEDGRIREIAAIADPASIADLDVTLLDA